MLKDLDWLCPPAPDFNVQVAALLNNTPNQAGEQVVALATAALGDTQLNKLSRLAAVLVKQDKPIAGLLKLKLGVLGDGTLSLLSPVIIGSALRHGLLIEIVEGGYNSAMQEAMDPTSQIRTAGLDMALIVSDARLLGLDQPVTSREAADAKVAAAFQHIQAIAENLRTTVASALLVQTLVPPLEPLFGSFDRLEPGSVFAMVEAFNRQMADWASDGTVVLVDIARLAASVGLEHWHDPRHWNASKLSFSPAMLPVYGDVVARTMAAVRGKSRKCLVLDLDNTLWGGVIGDDGVAGIKLGQGSASGEAFIAVQQMALALRARGIILAVCSKNEDDAARLPFREHPDMLIKEEHIAVFQANWTDKASNVRAIAETLNIGIDSLVFLDDNPAERLHVRRELPMVAVPELPDDPAYYPRMLAAAGYFEAVTFSNEDRERAGYYQANAERAASLSATSDIGSYLTSLDMLCTIGPVDDVSRPRVSQLINKSNQFNLTTRRYSENEVAAVAADPMRHILQVRLSDRFGDNGIISVIIADKAPDHWTIDTWLMSCRVLGRRVEEACLAHLVTAARQAGADKIIGHYIPSAKNRIVVEHYRKLGFEHTQTLADGTTVWALDVKGYSAPVLEMTIIDHFETAVATGRL